MDAVNNPGSVTHLPIVVTVWSIVSPFQCGSAHIDFIVRRHVASAFALTFFQSVRPLVGLLFSFLRRDSIALLNPVHFAVLWLGLATYSLRAEYLFRLAVSSAADTGDLFLPPITI